MPRPMHATSKDDDLDLTNALKNPDGTSIIPTIIPPAVEFPVVSTPIGAQTHEAAPPLSAVEEVRNSPVDVSRPHLSRQSITERPRPTPRFSTAPKFLRKGTNVSALNEALWTRPEAEDESSSSSSSSSSSDDEGDDEELQRETARNTRVNEKKGLKKGNNRADSAHRYSRFKVGNEDFRTKGKVNKKDGRLNISVNETNNKGYLAKALGATFMRHLGRDTDEKTDIQLEPQATPSQGNEADRREPSRSKSPRSKASSVSTQGDIPRPALNIVVMVIGSRGDIQPFLKLGKILKEEYHHRVRIATHPAFRDFVENDSGLEFFSVGGDPAELMAFMVKNPGMIPSMETVRAGEIGRRRDQMAEMFQGFWRACINATDDEKDTNNLKMMGDKHPFVADAIIANPPCFAHIHCAERLGIPLHLMFTFPYTPTQAFPHPLANIKKSNVDPGYTNFMSYPLVEMMTWQGLGDLVNDFRVKTLGLEPVSTLWAPGQLYRLKVPYTYLWSPGLVPKPKDWGPEIDIAGFVFLDLASSFQPPKELAEFLDAGEPPIYIGFGSIVVDDPDRFTKMIFEAVREAGVRALVSKGWGGLGGDDTPENIFMLENTPHDWLFPKVKAVVHHGGAGTTAIGLKCGKPTMIVPFFGDQQFWGSMVSKAGAGADAVPYKNLTMEKLAAGIKQCLTEEAQKNATQLAKDIEAEGDGAHNAVRSFHRSLNLRGEHSLRCSILEDRVAVWTVKNTRLRLSAVAADILVEQRKISWKQLRLIRHCEWNDFEGPGEPLTGGATAIVGTLTSMASGIGSVPFRMAKSSRRRQEHQEKKRRHSEHEERRRASSDMNTVANGIQRKDDTQLPPPSHQPDQANGSTEPKTEKSVRIPAPQRQTTQTKDFATMESSNTVEQSKDDGTTPDLTSIASPTTSHNIQQEMMNSKKDAGAEEANDSRNLTPAKVLRPLKGHGQKNNDDNDDTSVLSADPNEGVAEEMAEHLGRGLGKSGEAFVKAPMDLSIAVAQGFHNAPRLYGDSTVRKSRRITGYQSGLKAAGQEFVYGVYDGFSGLVVQPYTGARDNGVVGFVKGVGMGLTGFVLKDLAAIVGPFGYTLKGVHKELVKSRQPTHFIRKARIIQGQRDLRSLAAPPAPAAASRPAANPKPSSSSAGATARTDDGERRRAAVERQVAHGWAVFREVRDVVFSAEGRGSEKSNDDKTNKNKSKKKTEGLGLAGLGPIGPRLRATRERRAWQANGAFENVEMAERALEARRRGESLDAVFAAQREELRKAARPKRLVVEEQEAAQAKAGAAGGGGGGGDDGAVDVDDSVGAGGGAAAATATAAEAQTGAVNGNGRADGNGSGEKAQGGKSEGRKVAFRGQGKRFKMKK